MSKGLPTDPYKGVRDFYPADFAKREKIFSAWRAVARRFGYEPYDASPLEPTEIYAAKTGDEIIGEQTYTFGDRGDRSVTLRPEMTPSVARMVAARRRDLARAVGVRVPAHHVLERARRDRRRCDARRVPQPPGDATSAAQGEAAGRPRGARARRAARPQGDHEREGPHAPRRAGYRHHRRGRRRRSRSAG